MAAAGTNKELQAQIKNLKNALENSHEVLREQEERIDHLRSQKAQLEEIKLIHSKYLDIMSKNDNPFALGRY